jgi:hypothetical protein
VGRFEITADLEGTRYLYAAGVAWALFMASVLSPGQRHGRWPALIACVVLVTTAATVTWRNQQAWIHAAAARDAILSAIAGLPTECDRVFLAALPDTVNGAHVARNGVPQAVRLVHGRRIDVVRTAEETAPQCRVDFAAFATR